MRVNIRNLVVGVLLALILTCPAIAENHFAQFSQELTTHGDFRIEVETNKDVYYDKDVIILTVKLLNNSPFSLSITDEKQLPDGLDEGLVDGPILEGFLDGSDVDVAIMVPRSQVMIGYATLTPLSMNSDPDIDEPQTLDQNRISLPLFGNSEIPPHSTTIIATANVFIAIPYRTEPKSDTGERAHLQIIPVVDQYVYPTPGSYLLDCTININGSTQVAKAQKIIRIGSRF